MCNFSLSESCSQAAGFAVCGEIRVLVMLAIDSWILAGTESGQLWVYGVNTDVSKDRHEIKLEAAVLCLMHFPE